MTVEYNVPWGFFPILFKWKGSLWQLIYMRLVLFLSVFTVMTISYRFLPLSDQHKDEIHAFGKYFDQASQRIPITFLVGFYVNFMVGRWWEQFNSVVWPDRTMIFVTSMIRGTDERMRMVRRTMARWINLMSVLTWRSVSSRILKRFPTKQAILGAELVTPDEYMKLDDKCGDWQYWIPAVWICNLAGDLHADGTIDSIQFDRIISEVMTLRGQCGGALGYNWMNIPIVYTQVATMATYGFFFFRLLSNLPSDSYEKIAIETSAVNATSVGTYWTRDLYFPLMTVLEFCFYMGWLGVAEQLFNPWGEDEEDFELNYILDRNIKAGYVIADYCNGQTGTVTKDRNWDNYNKKTPHTVLSAMIPENTPKGIFYNTKFKDRLTKQVDIDDDELDTMKKRRVRDIMRMASKDADGKGRKKSSVGNQGTPEAEPKGPDEA